MVWFKGIPRGKMVRVFLQTTEFKVKVANKQHFAFIVRAKCPCSSSDYVWNPIWIRPQHISSPVTFNDGCLVSINWMEHENTISSEVAIQGADEKFHTVDVCSKNPQNC